MASSPRFPSVRTIVSTAALATVAAALLSLSKPVALRVDGHRMVSDVPPVTTAHGTYVPLRAVATSLGAQTAYDAKTGTIVLVRAGDTLRLRVGDRAATLDGTKMTLNVAPFAVRGRTMVPIATIAQAFGTAVRYDSARANIDVMTPGNDEPGLPDDGTP